MQNMLIHQILLKRLDLASLKSDINRLDSEKINTTTNNLSSLCNVIKNAVQETVYDELVKKAKATQTIDTRNLV